MTEAVKQAQKAFNDYAGPRATQVRDYQGKLAFIKSHFYKDPAEMERLLEQEAEANASWLDEYYRLKREYDLAVENERNERRGAVKRDHMRVQHADEIRMFGDWDEQIPWRHAKERGISEREYRKEIGLPE